MERDIRGSIMKKGKLIAVVPVRAGSQRVKDKNIKPFANSNLLTLKLQTLKNDFEEEEKNLQQEIISLQEEIQKLKKTRKTD